MARPKDRNISLEGLCAYGTITLLMVACLWGCASTDPVEEEKPIVYKTHYMDEGSTLVMEDPYYATGDQGLTLLEELKKTSEDLRAETEKNALLAQELMAIREARDQLKTDIETVKEQSIELNEQIATLKIQISEQEGELSKALREKQDILEKLVNLKIEKNKIEKELLKIKIAALSGEG